MANPAAIPAVGTLPTGLLPLPKERTYRAQDGGLKEKLTYDVSAFAANEVRKLMVLICEQEVQQQMDAFGNMPAFTEVDRTRGKSILQARRTIKVSFGARLKMAALNALRTGLRQAIQASTTTRTGKLSNPANWQFRYVHAGRARPLPTGGDGIPMGPGDFIVLMPVGVHNQKGQAYATAANMRVAGSGKLSFRRSAKQKRIRRKDQSIGFLALAARAAAASPLFDGFNVTAGFTSRHAVPGEVTRVGAVRTGYIRISPRMGKIRGRRG